jgi:hypothetical protein
MNRRGKHTQSGVYAAPADTSTLRAAYTGAGDLWRALDLTSIRDKAGLLRALAQALEFPTHFGDNWDALADSLQDLSWLQWSRLAIEVCGSDGLRRDAPQDWNIALDIFRDAATYWSAHHRSFLVLVRGASDLPVPGA